MTDGECKSEYGLEMPACAGMTEGAGRTEGHGSCDFAQDDVVERDITLTDVCHCEEPCVGAQDRLRDVAIQFLDLGEHRDEVVTRKRILVHSCCGPCSTSVVEFLVPDYDVTLFFYNPNITDAEEYERRLDAQRKFVEQYNENPDHDRPIKLIVATYNPEEFYVIAKDHEGAPEGGSRCTRCFELRISKTAAYAAMHSYETFTTTLSVSPHKDFERISRLGLEAALKYAVNFHVQDFKKKDGYRRSCELAKAYGLYRQNYCGCEYSLPHCK